MGDYTVNRFKLVQIAQGSRNESELCSLAVYEEQCVRAKVLSNAYTPDIIAERILSESLASGMCEWVVWSAAISRQSISTTYFDVLFKKKEFTVLL